MWLHALATTRRTMNPRQIKFEREKGAWKWLTHPISFNDLPVQALPLTDGLFLYPYSTLLYLS